MRLDLVVRVARDGVAFRYELPESAGAVVTGEATAFTRDAALARRAGERWFVGGIHAGPAAVAEVDLGRLGGSGVLLVELVTVGPDGRETCDEH
ncbi:glycoside hydrolase family 97 N-terminal domain-containing protein [Streptomyces radicis]|uniref:glycoside hydrolase family 97 N-terminal domain-containing protein n=1 Tax=Streptomyces radicis TaxID=1750517 RepID=UPI001E556234|nr:glycoside hydrolase family 97 N-terminal domain-containing protein [Streptomyces radicis]